MKLPLHKIVRGDDYSKSCLNCANAISKRLTAIHRSKVLNGSSNIKAYMRNPFYRCVIKSQAALPQTIVVSLVSKTMRRSIAIHS